MAKINQLSAVDNVVAGDQVPVYAVDQGDARKASFTTIKTFMQGNLDFGEGLIEQFTDQTATATEGFSIQITNGSDNIFLIMLGSGTLTAGTLVMPDSNTIVDQQEVLVSSLPGVTTLTMDYNGGFALNAAPTTLAQGGFFKMRFSLVNNGWLRVG